MDTSNPNIILEHRILFAAWPCECTADRCESDVGLIIGWEHHGHGDGGVLVPWIATDHHPAWSIPGRLPTWVSIDDVKIADTPEAAAEAVVAFHRYRHPKPAAAQ